MAICKEAEHLHLQNHGSVEFVVFFPLQSDSSSITCNDTPIFQNVLLRVDLNILKFCYVFFLGFLLNEQDVDFTTALSHFFGACKDILYY